MPTLSRTAFATVTGLWGAALIRGADGKMRALKLGDVVQLGDVILTSQDGIVQLTGEAGERRVVHAVAPTELDRVIAALNSEDPDAAPAAGLTAGDGGELTPGLRVDRIAETLSAAGPVAATTDIERVSTPLLTGDPADGQQRPLVALSSAISAVEEGSAVSLGLAAPPGIAATASVTIDEVPAIGQIVRADGSVVTPGSAIAPAELAGLRYLPPADYDGVAPVGRFAYKLESNGATTSGATTIALTAVNDAPVAAPGAETGAEDAALPVVIGLAGSDVDGSVSSVTVTTLPAGGTLLLADGVTAVVAGQVLTPSQAAALLYRPSADWNGATAIVYTVTDDAGSASAPAQFLITITPVNDAPVAAPDVATTPEDTLRTGNVLANDSDVDGPSLVVTQYTVAGTAHLAGTPAVIPGVGTLVVGSDGNYTFTPASDFNGAVPIVDITASDGVSATTSTLTLSVTPVDDAPVGADDLASTPINTPLTSIAVLANDGDADGDALSVGAATLVDPTQGGVSINADGTLAFTPALDVSGPVVISYTVVDATGRSDTATLVVNVGANTPPAGADAARTTAEDTPCVIAVADFGYGDDDAGQTLANVRIDSLPGVGVLSLDGTPLTNGAVVSAADIAAGRLVFTPASDANGSPYAGFTFSVQDSAGAWDPAPNAFTIAVTPVNDAPFVADDTAATDEDTPLVLTPAALLANDGDVDGDSLTIASVQDAVNGTVALVDGNVVFTPAPDYNGPASFTYTVSDGQGGTRTASVAVDLRPVVDPEISIGDVVVDEAAGTATFTVSLSQSTTATVSVDYASGNGSATAGNDYTAVTGTLTFAPGVTSQTITVPIADDAVYEGSEDFTVTLSTPVNATIADGSGTGTITDNDTPTLTVSSPSVAEGGGLAVFSVGLSNPSTQATTVSLSTTAASATAGADYSASLEVSPDGGTTWVAASSATIAAGSTSVLVRVPIVGDTIDELDETFTLTATRTAGTTSNASATGTATITDDDAMPTLAISDVAVNEAAGTATFTVTLNTASGLPVTVGYASSDGSATAGTDYTAVAGTLTFAPGVTSQTITVPIANDSLYEGSEDFTLALSAPTNATISDGSGVGVIVDDGSGMGGSDDDRPVVTSVTSPMVVEGDNLDFTITLSNASTTPTVVIEGSVGGSATVGVDTAAVPLVSFDGGATFTPAPGGSVSVPAGVTSFIVRLPTIDDALGEPAETITGTAATAANAAPVAGTGTILDNDTPVVSISGPVIYNEAAGTATYTVTLSNAATTPVSVNYATVAGSATEGVDYLANVGTLNFAPGVTSQTVTVSIADDDVYEGPETFSVTLSAPSGGTLGIATSTTTIVDNGSGTGGTDSDVPQVVAVGSATAAEGGNVDFDITLDNASTSPTTVGLTLTSGTATVATDTGPALVSFDGGASFSPVVGSSVSVPAGVTNFIVRVPALDDSTGEPTESFTLSAATAANIAPLAGTGSITDNDTPALTVSSPTLAENGGFAVFTVGLTNPSSTATTFSLAMTNGTATGGGSDYGAGGASNLQVSTNGGTSWTNATSATIAAGSTSVLVRTPISNDTIDEPDETFTLTATRTTGTTSNASASGTATITDNDAAPTLTVSSPSVSEGVASGFAQFTVALSNPSSAPVTLSLALANGTATGGGTDYGSAGPTNLQVSTNGGATWTSASSVTIAAGSTSVLVRTPIVNDALDEANETFTLTATRTAGTTANASATGTATITDNDPTPSLAISDVAVNEAAGTATFVVTLSAASGRAVSVNYATANNSATAGSDYFARSGSLTFAPGVTSQTVTVPIVDDATYEAAETFRVVLSGATNATIADTTGVATIAASDVPTLAVSAPSVAESAGFAVFTVSLSNASSTTTTVGLALTNGTAVGAGTDFGAGGATNLQVSTNGGTTWTNATSATFAAGVTSVLVRTPINNDSLPEAGETFTLTATRTAGTTSNAGAAGTATIVDNDGAPSLAISDVTVNEATGTATFTVNLSVASGQTVTVNYASANGSATSGSDYSGVSGTLSFAPGVTSQTITVPIANDSLYEGSEDFTVTLSAPVNATVADGSATGSIADNDTPTLAVSSSSVPEGGGFAVFTVSLTNASTQATTVSLSTTAGSATAGTDYSASLEVSTDGGTTWTAASSATIAAGSTSVLVRAPIVGDTVDELDESFTLTATRTSGTTSNVSATGTATITDDDATPALAISDVTVNEAVGTASFTVTLSAASGLPVTVDFGTADGSATAGSDYTGASGTLTFAAGVTSQTITVPIANDALYEGSEDFSVTLSAPVNATIADGSATGTITDNDTPALTVSSPTIAEGGGFAVFTVGLSNPSSQATTVSLSTTAASATAGADYSASLEVSADGGTTWAAASTATIAAGSTSVLVRAPVVGDTIDELDESFTLTATRTAGTTSNASATGTATITDDDATPTLAISDVTVNEGAGTASFTVTLSAASGLPVTVNYASADGSAAAGSDYTGGSGTLSFAPGVTSQTITVPITNDSTTEATEVFAVTLSGAANATIADGSGTAAIVDNDAAPVLDLDSNNSSGASGTGYAATFVENGAAVAVVDADVLLSDADSATLAGATVTLTNAQPGDVLATGAMPPGITATITATTVALTGSASAAAYQTALRAITFANTSDTPSTTPRTVTIVASDGAQTSNVATATIGVTPSNDAPVSTADAASTAEDTALTIARTTLLSNDTDPDGHALTITSVQGAVNGSVALVGPNVVFTPAAHYSGPASFTYTVSDGNGGTSTATVNVTVTAAADAPALTVRAAQPILVFENSWETVTSSDSTSEQINAATLEGWTRVDSPQGFGGGTNRFEVWTVGDDQQNENGDENVVVASQGNGQDFLELNDASSNVQTIGIGRSVSTVDGMVYELSLDYAGRSGFSENFTRIGVYLDGVLLQQYASTSPQGYIDWENLKISFQGDGGNHTLTIRTDATQFNSNGRGAFIDDLRLTATQGVVAGNSGATTSIELADYVSASLLDTDGSESITLAFSDVPAGATIVTAGNPGGYAASGGVITISGSELATAQLRFDSGVTGHLSIGVTATAAESSNGSSAASSDTLEVDVVPAFVATNLAGDNLNEVIGTNGNNGSLGGSGSADYILGLDGNDTLNGASGSNGNDVLDGGGGNDTLRGGAGADILIGGAGSDTLAGGTGADVFAWTLADRGAPGSAPTDTIGDFDNGATGDVLDLRDLLVGENTGNLADYLHFAGSGSTTTISISSTGGFAGGYSAGAADQVIQISNVNLVGSMSSDAQVIADLISRGKLMVDNS